MTINDIIAKFGDLKIIEDRGVDADEAEFVVFNEELHHWRSLFEECLGEPVKKQGKKPTKEDLLLTKNYGGIYDRQILYKKDFDNYAIMAMFWPWGDNTQTTIKLYHLS